MDVEILDTIINYVYIEGLKDSLMLYAELDTN
jgi:hypothetical protein